MMGTPLHIWLIFGIAIVIALALDLGVFHRRAHAIQLKEALVESAAWISVALLFNLWLYFSRGPQAGVEFFTAYLVEKSLSIDNIFVFLLIFQAFKIPPKSQHRVLYFGIAGALVLRAAFVLAGITLLQAFHPVIYLFGAILLFTGVRMLLPRQRALHPENNWMVRVARRFIPVADGYEGQQFLVSESGKWKATPLFLALVAVEAMDIIFAVDSVPAVLAITRDTFIVYSSNVFAILGLRALYFALADLLPRFRFLHQGLAAIIIFVGTKMVVSDHFPVSAVASLVVIAIILSVTIITSLIFPRVGPTPNSV
ncbi:MAG TPA: TerC family protein [Candidatus Acidoferrales bacterium]|nr:TerC family protein [Candidatus Acidoferrales bacterium]